MIRKYASFNVLAAAYATRESTLLRTAHKAEFDYEPTVGMLYVRSRAISSRCNDNGDEFPAAEIKKAWRTFIGKPVFCNHHNENHRRARGVIVDAALHEDFNKDGSPDTWVEVLMEIDAVHFPKLAEAVVKGEIARTSMGTDVEYSLCSFCGNKAATPAEYCKHIPRLKLKRIRRMTASGSTEDVLISEICYGLHFFENSLLVEEPADPTAFTWGVDTRGLSMSAAKDHDVVLGDAPITKENPRGVKCKVCEKPVTTGGYGWVHRKSASVDIASETEYDPFAPGPGVCPECYGDGAYSVLKDDGTWGEEQTCSACQGSGKIASKTATTGEYNEGREQGEFDQAHSFPIMYGETEDVPDTDEGNGYLDGFLGIPKKEGGQDVLSSFKLANGAYPRGQVEHQATRRPVLAKGKPMHRPDLLGSPTTKSSNGHQGNIMSFGGKRVASLHKRADIACPECDWRQSGSDADAALDHMEQEHDLKLTPEQRTQYKKLMFSGRKLADKINVTFAKDMNGSWQVHAPNCPDLKKNRGRNYEENWSNTVDSLDTAYQEVYHPDEFVYDPTNTEEAAAYKNDVRVMPCANKMGKLAYGETIAPPQVDTMRDEECPVCGSDLYDGDQCQVCQFIKPPDMFMDPDLSAAQDADFRQDSGEDQLGDQPGQTQDLTCDTCGEAFPGQQIDSVPVMADPGVNQEPTNVAANPQSPLDIPQGTVDPMADPNKSTPEQPQQTPDPTGVGVPPASDADGKEPPSGEKLPKPGVDDDSKKPPTPDNSAGTDPNTPDPKEKKDDSSNTNPFAKQDDAGSKDQSPDPKAKDPDQEELVPVDKGSSDASTDPDGPNNPAHDDSASEEDSGKSEETLKPGDPCPSCGAGTLKEINELLAKDQEEGDDDSSSDTESKGDNDQEDPESKDPNDKKEEKDSPPWEKKKAALDLAIEQSNWLVEATLNLGELAGIEL